MAYPYAIPRPLLPEDIGGIPNDKFCADKFTGHRPGVVWAIYGATQRDIAAATVLGLLAFTAVVFERMIEATQKDSQG